MMRVKFEKLEFTEQYDHDGEYTGRSAKLWKEILVECGDASSWSSAL